MADRHLNIVIAARSQVNQAFADALNQTKRFGADVAKANADAANQAIRMVSGIGKARIAVDAARIAVNVFQGDWDQVNETIDRLPFGIGEVAKSVRALAADLADPVFQWWYEVPKGAAEEFARAAKNTEAAAARTRDLNAAFKEVGDLRRSQSGGGPMARILAEAESVQRRMEELAKRFPELQQEAAHASAMAWVEYFAAFNRMMREQRERQEDERRKQAETIRELDSEIRQRTLDAQGRDMEAEIERVREHYRRRIEEAKSAAEKERLIRLRQLDEEAIQRRHAEQAATAGVGVAAPTASRAGIAAVHVGAGFHGIAAQFAGGRDPMMRLNRNTDRIADLIQQVLRAIHQRPEHVIAGTVVRL